MHIQLFVDHMMVE